MSKKHLIFVDGQEGTTGLKIHDMLASRDDIEVIRISPERRKDPSERSRLINEADLVFLCLPDDASREAVSMVSNPKTRLIDTSTAFRTNTEWAYGLPELAPTQRQRIRESRRVANPGCHATAFILLARPLVDAGLIQARQSLAASSITGFSGGGKKMIEEYRLAIEENASTAPFRHPLWAPRPYALGLAHKHLPEMTLHSGLVSPPVFMPIVGPFYQGLTLTISLVGDSAQYAQNVHVALARAYEEEPFVRVLPLADPETLAGGFFDTQRCNQTNRADLFVFHNGCNLLLMACIDNLGKGASGAAVQNMNLMLGLGEGLGLTV